LIKFNQIRIGEQARTAIKIRDSDPVLGIEINVFAAVWSEKVLTASVAIFVPWRVITNMLGINLGETIRA